MYGKCFASMYTGSMRGAGIHVFALWNYILACCDSTGTIEINPEVVAFLLGAANEDITDAIKYLEAEDKQSRSEEEEGRRIIKEGRFQYRIVNYAKYRTFRSVEERRRYNAAKQAEYRARKKESKNA